MRVVCASNISFSVSTYSRGALATGAESSASPASAQRRRWRRCSLAATAACASLCGTTEERRTAPSV